MLKGKNVILAPMKKEYIKTFLKWINDPEIIQYLLLYRPMTLEMEETKNRIVTEVSNCTAGKIWFTLTY